MSLRKGYNVWVEDKNSAWIAAEVVDVTEKRAIVVADNGKKVSLFIFQTQVKPNFNFIFYFLSQITTSGEKLLPRDPEADGADHGGVDDMTKLTYLNEPGVLFNLARRYALNEIYVGELHIGFYFILSITCHQRLCLISIDLLLGLWVWFLF